MEQMASSISVLSAAFVKQATDVGLNERKLELREMIQLAKDMGDTPAMRDYWSQLKALTAVAVTAPKPSVPSPNNQLTIDGSSDDEKSVITSVDANDAGRYTHMLTHGSCSLLVLSFSTNISSCMSVMHPLTYR